MATKRRTAFNWTRRPHTERRVHARVALEFPIDLALDPRRPPVPAVVTDVGLGGVRVRFDRYLELFQRFEVTMAIPVDGDGEETTLETVTVRVAVVRIEPDEEGPPDTEYDISLSFTRVSEAQQRAIAMFMLQRLLYDQDAELL
ncbi:MAG: PilZ domain-containing protein [Myxococcota bacterium]|jgi:c-di-GMP-binding flagellar brake protein YcgR|nr:PilZ domain-containing protein [Myxococcota bacterium]